MDNTSECFGFDVHNAIVMVMNEWNCLGCLKNCLSSEGRGEQLEGNFFQVDSQCRNNLMWVKGRKQTPTWKSKTGSEMSQKKAAVSTHMLIH